MITHGLFTGNEFQGLGELGVSRIFCTDTIPLPVRVDPARLVTLSAVPTSGRGAHRCCPSDRRDEPTMTMAAQTVNEEKRQAVPRAEERPPRRHCVFLACTKTRFRCRPSALFAMCANSRGCTRRAWRGPAAPFMQTLRKSTSSPIKPPDRQSFGQVARARPWAASGRSKACR